MTALYVLLLIAAILPLTIIQAAGRTPRVRNEAPANCARLPSEDEEF